MRWERTAMMEPSGALKAGDWRLKNLNPVKPGQVLNPKGGGAPSHALAHYIRRQTNKGKTLIDFLIEVLKGENLKFVKVSDRLTAAKELLNRGWGQAPQQLILSDGTNKPLLDLSKLDAAEFEQFKVLASKIAATIENEQETQDGEIVDAAEASQDGSGTTISTPDVPK